MNYDNFIYLNCDKINKKKRSKIGRIVYYIQKNNDSGIVRKIIIFGSSTRFDCRDNSDIDICIISDRYNDIEFMGIVNDIWKISDRECDFVYYNVIEDFLKDIIDSSGVCVYEL